MSVTRWSVCRSECPDKALVSTLSDAAAGTDEVITELNKRAKRSSDIIVYGLDEVSNLPLQQSALKDAESAGEVLNQIYASDYRNIRSCRMGRPTGTLQLADIIKDVLRNKCRYSGLLKIADDKTQMQPSNLKRLWDQLSELHTKGDTNRTNSTYQRCSKDCLVFFYSDQKTLNRSYYLWSKCAWSTDENARSVVCLDV